MGGGLTAFFQGLFTLLSGPMGIAIVGVLLVYGLLEAIGHRSMRPIVWPLFGGAAFYAVSWIMSTVMQGNGG
jgi:hypothetical protein